MLLYSFQKDKIPEIDRWTTYFFIDFYDIVGDDLLQVVEEVRLTGEIPRLIKSTFINLIPWSSKPYSFNEYMHISLCNMVCKIISKVLVVRIRKLLSNIVSFEKFMFPRG